jgi:hypothetical protein
MLCLDGLGLASDDASVLMNYPTCNSFECFCEYSARTFSRGDGMRLVIATIALIISAVPALGQGKANGYISIANSDCMVYDAPAMKLDSQGNVVGLNSNRRVLESPTIKERVIILRTESSDFFVQTLPADGSSNQGFITSSCITPGEPPAPVPARAASTMPRQNGNFKYVCLDEVWVATKEGHLVRIGSCNTAALEGEIFSERDKEVLSRMDTQRENYQSFQVSRLMTQMEKELKDPKTSAARKEQITKSLAQFKESAEDMERGLNDNGVSPVGHVSSSETPKLMIELQAYYDAYVGELCSRHPKIFIVPIGGSGSPNTLDGCGLAGAR